MNSTTPAFVTGAPLSISPRQQFSYRTVVCSSSTPSQAPMEVSRRAMLITLASATGSLLAATRASAQEGLQYKVVQEGKGPAAEIGDLVGIRFKGTYNGVVFDNLFEDKTPYFYRVGSGSILKGLEQALVLMKVGDIYDLTIPGDLAFGSKGRRASAGKPSIPPNATVNYTLELTTIPGREEELLESSEDY